ncbi:MAG TPA: M20/M25/M40 family metallo-hydrolase [Candidatus Limnocylindrales bacterium]|nr:M20/M25/M40 family metallo-hydrolase [Candidatus Limnocylindrales bacterium]
MTQAIELLRRMLEIESVSGEEAALSAYLARTLAGWGFRVRVDAVGNFIGEIDRGPGPTVMLLGHLDTVAGAVDMHLEGDRLYGRGAVDAKGPLAAMICAAATTSAAGRVVVVGAVQEETPGSLGAMEIRRTYPPPDALVVGEPSGWSNVVLGFRGKLDLSYEVSCPAGHPTSPTPKASELAVRAWTTLTELLGPHATHRAFNQPGATLVAIDADQVRARACLSVRTPPGFDAQALVDGLRAALPLGTLAVVNAVAACRTGRRNPVVRALSTAIRAQGGEPGLRVKTGTSDMNTLAEVWHIPMATYGPGDSTLDHTDDEHIVIPDYLRGIAVLTEAIDSIAENA